MAKSIYKDVLKKLRDRMENTIKEVDGRIPGLQASAEGADVEVREFAKKRLACLVTTKVEARTYLNIIHEALPPAEKENPELQEFHSEGKV